MLQVIFGWHWDGKLFQTFLKFVFQYVLHLVPAAEYHVCIFHRKYNYTIYNYVTVCISSFHFFSYYNYIMSNNRASVTLLAACKVSILKSLAA